MDMRSIPCSIKHGLIIKQWLELPVGDHFILLNDHDPVPLYYQFAAQWPDAFAWQHLMKSPEEVCAGRLEMNVAVKMAGHFSASFFAIPSNL